MDPATEHNTVDPDALARLVLHCREFRAYVDELDPLLPRRAQTPFLYRQLDAEIERLREGLESIGREPGRASGEPARKAGLIGRLLGRGGRGRETQPDEPTARADFEGSALTIPVSELVGFLSSSRKTGVLCVNSMEENFIIEIRNGQLVRATSDRTPHGFRLGELLVKQGLLREDEIPTLVAEARASASNFGLYLLREGHVREEDLKTTLATQVQGLFYRLVGSTNSFYRFQEGVDLSDTQALSLNVTSLLLESARFHDERGRSGRVEDDAAIDAALAAAEAELRNDADLSVSELLENLEDDEDTAPDAPAIGASSEGADAASDGEPEGQDEEEPETESDGERQAGEESTDAQPAVEHATEEVAEADDESSRTAASRGRKSKRRRGKRKGKVETGAATADASESESTDERAAAERAGDDERDDECSEDAA